MRGGLRRAVILIGHGSKMKGFQSSMARVARELRQDKRFGRVVCAYLEITPPSISSAIDDCAARGADEISLLPYFVLSGMHVRKDIPRIIAQARRRHARKVKIKLCPSLGYHKKIVDVVKERLAG